MKKFSNVIDQINEVLRQQWTLQACAARQSAPATPQRCSSRSPPPASA